MNWADQQPGESRAAWKDRTFFLRYGGGFRHMPRAADTGTRAHSLFEQLFANGMPKVGDTVNFTFAPREPGNPGGWHFEDGFADSFTRTPPSAGPTYFGRPDDWTQGGRQWFAGEGETRTERLLNELEDWDQLGVELPDLLLVPTPTDEGVFVITRLEA